MTKSSFESTSIGKPQSRLRPPQNPFATRFIRPGAIRFQFPRSIDVARLVARFADFRWRGAIVGPHGSGKSTLLAELRPELTRANRRIIQVSLHDRDRRLPAAIDDSERSSTETLIIVDGYEQLSGSSRRALDRRCRRTGSGLLVTSHGATHLPELYQTAIDLELLERIVERLTGGDRRFVSAADVEQAFSRHGQNAREALFSLYDLHEHRWRELAEQL
ncbi:MAG TPA: hypothetical protein VGH32_12190 [Pirellulales bacterium]|jgi:hypothetical protein